MRDKRRLEISDKEGLRLNSYRELKHLLVSLFLFSLLSLLNYENKYQFFFLYLSLKDKLIFCNLKETEETVQMVCKVSSIFYEIFKIYTYIHTYKNVVLQTIKKRAL